MTEHELVLVVDFGAQYAQLIARRVREAKVYSEIVPHSMPVEEMLARNPKAIILSGGPQSVYAEGAPRVESGLFEAGVPAFGICYGFQAMALTLGGEVRRTGLREFGRTPVTVSSAGTLLAGIPEDLNVWMSHGDAVQAPPAGFAVLAASEGAPVAAFEDLDRRLAGVQWHPEVLHSQAGQAVLEHFLYDIAGCKGDWTTTNVVEEQVELIRQQVGDKQVLCALSGGVDSAVAAALVHKAIGDQLTCIFVDNGVLRLDEAAQIRKRYERLRLPLVFVDASTLFLDRLAGVTDPETKRKAIGATFIEVFEAEAARLGDVDFLAQGTLYPDVIESISIVGQSSMIKSHHNVGGLPERMRMTLIEPLRELFKDEVRAVGRKMGLEEEFVVRQPFPGPGLAVRILGEVSLERLTLLRKADAIVTDEVRRAGWYTRLWQSFAVLLPVQSVGVMGDERTYEYTIAIRAVESRDGMTADWARLPHDLLAQISSRIVNEVKGINRVVYDISSKPPSTIEWE